MTAALEIFTREETTAQIRPVVLCIYCVCLHSKSSAECLKVLFLLPLFIYSLARSPFSPFCQEADNKAKLYFNINKQREMSSNSS